MKYILHLSQKLFFITLISLLHSACSDDNAINEAKTDAKKTSGLAIGTNIADLKKNANSDAKSSSDEGSALASAELTMWPALIPKGHEPNKIIDQYKDKIEQMDDNSEEAKALFDKINTALNNAPTNTELNGKIIKIPGFVALIDEKDGKVTEFILAPYYGSCIHTPPPPINQTIYVTADLKHTLPIEDIFKPVWVTGVLQTEKTKTPLAHAGYVIKNAELSLYEEDERDASSSDAEAENN